ncbi:hypothetical protein HYALB_00011510 [Hymenoscyphus albidus]|uniref:Uncharacterized protein n=1 Tax=Hymenoscyphus albidus TaxID=595503 RepID=A0A9N9Q882_9HELO|nr:hypothetical protein HYALB_00011510 [Hymenoscyphus albidus]
MTQGEMAACMGRRAAAIASASSSNVAASSGGAASESSSMVAALSGSAASKASPNVVVSSDAVAKAAGQASQEQSFNSSKSKTHGVTSSLQVAPEGTVSDEGRTEGRIPRTPTHIFHGENKPLLPLDVNERPQFSAYCTARNAFSGFIGHDQERAMLKAAEEYLQVTLRLAILPNNEGCVVWGDPRDPTEQTIHPEVFASRMARCQDCLVQWARHRIPGTDDLTMNFDCWFRVWRWNELKREIRGQSSVKPSPKP